MKVFISNLNGPIGLALLQVFKEEEENEVVGTLPSVSRKGREVKGAAQVVGEKDKAAVQSLILSSDVIIYVLDSNLVEAGEALRVLKRDSPSFESPKTFLLISSLLTWGESDTPLSESMYTSRKSQSKKYVAVRTFENQVISANRDQLVTRVVGSGVVYGRGESIFRDIFKNAWLCSTGRSILPKYTPFQNCENFLPTIYLGDLARVVEKTVATPPDSPYILAVDKGRYTLKEITASIVKHLSGGEVQEPSVEEMEVLKKSKDETLLDTLACNLSFDPETSSAGKLGVEWTCEGGIISSLPLIVKEFIDTHQLVPVRVVMTGPPSSGKSFWSKTVSKLYSIPHLTVTDVIKETMEVGSEGGGSDIKVELTEFREREPEGRIPAELLAKMVRHSLTLPERRNKGWVLDGLPRTHTEARLIFSLQGDDGAEIPEGEASIDPRLLPSSVVSFYAADEELAALALERGEGEMERFRRRLRRYKEEGEAAQSFFEVVGRIDTLMLPGHWRAAERGDIVTALRLTIEKGRRPNNFQVSDSFLRQEEEAKRAEANRVRAQVAGVKEQVEEGWEEGAMERRLREIEAQMQQVEEARKTPLRDHLMAHLVPRLTAGLTEISKVQPEDVLDYLAEYMLGQ